MYSITSVYFVETLCSHSETHWNVDERGPVSTEDLCIAPLTERLPKCICKGWVSLKWKYISCIFLFWCLTDFPAAVSASQCQFIKRPAWRTQQADLCVLNVFLNSWLLLWLLVFLFLSWGKLKANKLKHFTVAFTYQTRATICIEDGLECS